MNCLDTTSPGKLGRWGKVGLGRWREIILAQPRLQAGSSPSKTSSKLVCFISSWMRGSWPGPTVSTELIHLDRLLKSWLTSKQSTSQFAWFNSLPSASKNFLVFWPLSRKSLGKGLAHWMMSAKRWSSALQSPFFASLLANRGLPRMNSKVYPKEICHLVEKRTVVKI